MDNNLLVLLIMLVIGLSVTVYLYIRQKRGKLWLSITSATIILVSLGLYLKNPLLYIAAVALQLFALVYYFSTKEKQAK